MPFVSRAGRKLQHALDHFRLDVSGLVCADLGCHVGGFTDCLLQRGAARIYAVDTGYGILDYKLRKHPSVVTLERTNALHLSLPEPVDLAVIDVAWTRQTLILPAARRLLRPTGQIVSLVKPHYEAPKSWLRGGILPPDKLPEVLADFQRTIPSLGLRLLALTDSPILGTAGNRELLAHLTPLTPIDPLPPIAPAL